MKSYEEKLKEYKLNTLRKSPEVNEIINHDKEKMKKEISRLKKEIRQQDKEIQRLRAELRIERLR